jgi:hypothetical protein
MDEWDARGGSIKLDHHLVCDHTDTVDKRLFLDHLEIKPDTMENLVSVGSIDAKEGDDSGAYACGKVWCGGRGGGEGGSRVQVSHI